jgi:serine/threonine protein kinase
MLNVGGRERLAGTPSSASEAIEGAAPSVGFDLWALSLVLFEAMAGSHPFASRTVPEVFSKISRMQSLDLARFRPDCPPTVALAFSRMLSRHPLDRPPSAAALRTILTRLV